MNSIKQSVRRFPTALAIAVSAMALSSCGSVFDDLEPCQSGVDMRFVYEYNLDSSDAFHSSVDCLSLYIYDSHGKFVTSVTETSDRLADRDFRLPVDLDPGIYHAVAYGGIACEKASFAHRAVPAAGSVYTDIDMALTDSHVGKRLHDHFHGTVDFTVDRSATGYTSIVMLMTKTTNHFRILLHHIDRSPIDGNDFDYFITDDNSRLDHANNPVTGHSITYPHWTKGTIYASSDDEARSDTSDGLDEAHAAYGELSTSRLTLKTRPVLTIKNRQSGREVLRLPLTTYLLMGRSEADDFGDQEFLDRCSRWTLTFFLDRDNKWPQTYILVNGWVVRIENMDM